MSENVKTFAMPDRIAIDANGYGWRVFDDAAADGEVIWSMVPVNPDNSPIPQPCTFFVNDDLLRAALNENDQEKQMLMAENVQLRGELDKLRSAALAVLEAEALWEVDQVVDSLGAMAACDDALVALAAALEGKE